MQDKITILLSADERYARHCAVTILSVLSNTDSGSNIQFSILTPDFSRESTEKLEKLCQIFGATVTFITINLERFSSLPSYHKHFNLNNYSRICGPDLCISCDRLIYLDCDLLVLGDISELFHHQLNGKPIGAVPHVQIPYQKEFISEFSLPETDTYFNSGVLIIDTDTWRKKDYANAILTVANEHSHKLHFADQDAFNALFWGNYFHLPGVWNVEARLYKEKLLGLPQTDEIAKRMQSPKIIHYTGPDKPWSSKNYVPKRELYLEYSDRLSELIGWRADSEVRRCNFLSIIYFLWSCFYFRMSWNLRNLLKI